MYRKNSRTRTTSRRKSAPAIILTTLLIWLGSCTSTPTASSDALPRILPPDPYDENGEIVMQLVFEGEPFTPETEGVFLPYWYWEKIFDYIVDTQAAQDINGAEK